MRKERANVLASLPQDVQVTYQLLYPIADIEGAYWCTDGISYILAQSADTVPLWMWLSDTITAQGKAFVTSQLAERMAARDVLRVNTAPKWEGLLQDAAEQAAMAMMIHVRMYAYACEAVRPLPIKGTLLSAAPIYREDVARLHRQHVEDALHTPMTDEAAYAAADAIIEEGKSYLWEDAGICSIVKITNPDSDAPYVRIGAVATDRTRRGNGYIGMLLSTVNRMFLQKGRIPMLYADADYPSSNRAYQKIGFQQKGQINEYHFTKIKGESL